MHDSKRNFDLIFSIAPSKMSRISTAASALFNYSVEASHETRTKSEPRKSLTSAGPLHKRERVSTGRKFFLGQRGEP